MLLWVFLVAILLSNSKCPYVRRAGPLETEYWKRKFLKIISWYFLWILYYSPYYLASSTLSCQSFYKKTYKIYKGQISFKGFMVLFSFHLLLKQFCLLKYLAYNFKTIGRVRSCFAIFTLTFSLNVKLILWRQYA